MNTTMNTWVGLDVSKDTIEVCLLRENGKEHFKQFSNDQSGHLKLLRWVQHLASDQHLAPDAAIHFCLEATGSYSNSIALFLAEAEQAVSVMNPARIHYFARAQGQGNKTDKADARLIALFCRKEEPELWRAAAPEVRELVALVRRYHAVQDLLVPCWCRRKTACRCPPSPKPCCLL